MQSLLVSQSSFSLAKFVLLGHHSQVRSQLLKYELHKTLAYENTIANPKIP